MHNYKYESVYNTDVVTTIKQEIQSIKDAYANIERRYQKRLLIQEKKEFVRMNRQVLDNYFELSLELLK